MNIPKIIYYGIAKWKSSDRKTPFSPDCILIGHSYATHSFMLKGYDPPNCIPFDELLPIEHIPLHCSDLIDVKDNFIYCDFFEGIVECPSGLYLKVS